jgi:hypothetical protein
LYALDTSLNLYSINPGTGAATLLGATGLSASCYCGLSSNGSTLYFSNGSNLYTLSTVNGAATSVGSTGGATFGGLLSESSTTLYGGLTSVSTLSTTNGAASAGVTITGTGAGTVFGLAADPLTISAVPEPATYALMLAGLGLMGVVVRRREAKP